MVDESSLRQANWKACCINKELDQAQESTTRSSQTQIIRLGNLSKIWQAETYWKDFKLCPHLSNVGLGMYQTQWFWEALYFYEEPPFLGD